MMLRRQPKRKIDPQFAPLLAELSLAYEEATMASEDHVEAVAALKERRPGTFTGR